MPLPAGTHLGSFEILRAIGAGGMGEVYLARDPELNRSVAIKVLPPEVTADAHRTARFEQEARAASALNHPNVCVVHALGRTDDGRRFIAMEHVEGETLRQRLVRGRLAIPDALDIAAQIASALTAAHAAGIVHRDIKPENVMIRRDRLVKVLDFGLAKLPAATTTTAGDEPTRTLLTDAGAVVGTVAYMSPEQARAGDVDGRTDIWAVGVVLYEMIAGRPPFTGNTRSDVLASILQREPAPLVQHQPHIPAELQRIVGKSLHKDSDERYQVIKDLLLDVKALRTELAGSSSAGGSIRTVGMVEYSSRWRLVAAIVGSLAVAVAGAWWWASRPAGPAETLHPTSVHPLTRLTFDSGLQTGPTFSPDGRFIAYASDRSGNFDIWVQPIGGGDAVQVTRAPAHDTQPAWSPDGTMLVFRSERDHGGLFTVPALGGIERQLASFGMHPIWTADSREVLFVSGAVPGEGLWPMRLHRVALDGSAPHEVLREFLTEGAWYWVAPHPDGRISAWGQHARLGDGFYTVATDGKSITASQFAAKIPIAAIEQGRRRRFTWSPDGTALFVQAAVSNVYNLWKVHVDRKDLSWTSAQRMTTGAGADVLGALSADAKRLAFGTQTESSRLWLFELGSTQLTAGRPLTEEGTNATFGTFSPDGKRVAYNLDRPGTNRLETWVAPLDGGRAELITTEGDSPIWSPDGNNLAYGYLRSEGSRVVEVRNVVRRLGGAERPVSQVLRDRAFFPKQWTRAGQLLGLYSTTENTAIALWPTTRADASEPDRLLASHSQGSLWQPSFSPNGRWLMFVMRRSGDLPDRLELFVAPADGAPPERWTRVAPDHPWPDKPRWARDGRTLYFISRRLSAFFNVWGLPFDPERGVPVGAPFALSSFDSPGLYISPSLDSAEMDVSGRHLMLTMRAVTGSIWMLEDVDQ